MGFREREKQRLGPLKPHLFSDEACEWGIYRGKAREFCLCNDRAKENLHANIRDETIRYCRERKIGWH